MAEKAQETFIHSFIYTFIHAFNKYSLSTELGTENTVMNKTNRAPALMELIGEADVKY